MSGRAYDEVQANSKASGQGDYYGNIMHKKESAEPPAAEQKEKVFYGGTTWHGTPHPAFGQTGG